MKPYQLVSLGLTLVMAFLLIAGGMTAAHAQSDDYGTGQLRIRSDQTTAGHDALLLNTHMDIVANAIQASVTLTQTFQNTLPDWAEGVYVFPLPDKAAVDKLELIVGNKKIVGKIREKKEAKRIYEVAKNNGQKVALLEMNRDNLFTAKVANIPPNSDIKVTIHFTQPIRYEKGSFSLRLPTTYTPRYLVRQTFNSEKTSTQAIADPLPQQVFSTTTHNPMTVNISLYAGAKIERIHSSSHDILTTIDATDQVATITLADKNAPMDKDILLNWQLVPTAEPLALAFNEQTPNGYFTSLMVMPPMLVTQETHSLMSLPRETLLIIDTSGSMSGKAMRQAKAGAIAALDYLRAEDYFNLIEFDSNYTTLFSQSQPANADNLYQARRFIEDLKADEGTEMYAPLNYALTSTFAQNDNEKRLKQVVFLTDGSVNNEKGLFRLIHNKLGDTRLFTVGIGSAPNSLFMEQAAKFGRGTFTYISDIDEVGDKIQTLFEQLQSPVLTDIELDLPSGTAAEIFPKPIADLYQGQPIVAHLKSNTPLDNEFISLTGTYQGLPWQSDILASTQPNAYLDKRWARENIDALNTDSIINDNSAKNNAEILKLGLAYQLATSQTSFVAIEELISRNTQFDPLVQQQVANQLPHGSLHFPATATSSTLTALIGFIALLLAGLVAIISQCRLYLRFEREESNRFYPVNTLDY